VSWVDPPNLAVPLRTIRIDGNRIAYRIAGDGPLLLLLHGMAGSSATWRYVMPKLTSRFTVLAPDLLGHGASDKPAIRYSIDTFARATVVGQSLGGGVAMQLAVGSPERCERLVLVAAGGLGHEVTPFLRVLSVPWVEQLFPLVCSPPLRRRLERGAGWLERFGARAGPAGVEIWQSYASLTDPEKRRVFFHSLRAVVDFHGQMMSALEQITRKDHPPTLIVWGAQDPFVPLTHALTAHRLIEGSRLEIFEGVGHYPHCEAPERFVEVLVDFIASTEPAGSVPDLPPSGEETATIEPWR
jgi:pimeloyl-ACP methyl ester carboxylesterase